MELLQQVVNGVQLGVIYALVALGYTMVYGVVRLVNFAHGDVYMLGAFVGFFAATRLGLGFLPTLLVSMAACALLGVVIERLAYRPLRQAPRIAALTTAIGVSLLLQNLVRLTVGPNPRGFPELFTQRTLEFAGLRVYNISLIVLGVSLGLMLCLQYVVYRTRLGIAMRAVSLDKDAARLMGIDVDKVISVTFAIGSALAAAAGVMVALAYTRIDPFMGMLPGLKAFVAAVLGGIGNIGGAVLGGLLMGVAETMVVGMGLSTLRDAVAFAVLITVLLFKPAGLLGRAVREKV
ncbi:MAG: branched-chain amino acid ABC transporter permease [Bacillota bacterium]